jgi:uncharacterized protein (TIGR03067 family)
VPKKSGVLGIDALKLSGHRDAEYLNIVVWTNIGGSPMLRGALLIAALGIGTVFAVGADPKPVDDLEAIQGNWKPLQIEFEGKSQMKPEVMAQLTSVYDKSEYFLYFVDIGTNGTPEVLLLAKTNIKLDQQSKPKGITFEFTEGSLKGKIRHGIYEIAGNQLKLCYGEVGQPRPTEFKSAPGNGYFLETWARKPK